MFNDDDTQPAGYAMINSTSDRRIIKPTTDFEEMHIDDWVRTAVPGQSFIRVLKVSHGRRAMS